MAEFCFDEPGKLLSTRLCVSNVSKNMKGELERKHAEREKCSEPKCITLKTVHRLKVELRSHKPCDSDLGRKIDGTLVIERLVTAYDEDGERRGIHAGDFEWSGSGFVIKGRMSGVTNAGTDREPPFKPCQECYAPGIMEGRLCGTVVESKVKELADCPIVATYQIHFDPSTEGGEGAIGGTLEGALLCHCHG